MEARVCVVMAMTSLLASPATVARDAESGRGYIYDAMAAGDHRAVVIDAVTRYVAIQDRRDAKVDDQRGAFGGYYKNCGNARFHCLEGSLDIVVPRTISVRQWNYRGLSCKRTGEPVGDTIQVRCTSSRHYRTGTTFTYSLSRGILSFGNSRVGGTRGGFVLRGQHGLFSRGNDP